MNKAWWIRWLKSTMIQSLKAMSQTAIVTISTSAVLSEINWMTTISASILSGILSFLFSLCRLPNIYDTNNT